MAAGPAPAFKRGEMESDINPRVVTWGTRIFELADVLEPHGWSGRAGFSRALMRRTMRDPDLEVRLFRFVDVLPSLQSSNEIAEHLREYLTEQSDHLPPGVKLGLRASGVFPWLVGAVTRHQVERLASQFMLGSDRRSILEVLTRRHRRGLDFTLDLLGEAVVSEPEADEYAARYLDLLAWLGTETRNWPPYPGEKPRAQSPRINLSIKVSALASQIHPTAPESAIKRISSRLRPILRQARELQALIHFDMEQYALKDLTLHLFQQLFSEPEFAQEPACGVVLQAYLRDSERDLLEMIRWARERARRFTIRLVKGAYWEYETTIARQRGWPVPVFSRKAETDLNFERLSTILLDNIDAVEPAFGSHNVRSQAHVLAQAERRQLSFDQFEFQLLYGMADVVKLALVQLGCRVREYGPVGDLLPGMAYLVRRLLENTSNEGFLAQNLSRSVDRAELLRDPAERLAGLPADRACSAPRLKTVVLPDRTAPDSERPHPRFLNEPPTDFTQPTERKAIQQALQSIRGRLGRRHPLVIANQPVATKEWLASLNPANQQEVIGYAAQATPCEADAALTSARATRNRWARTSAETRAGLLESVAGLMRRDKAALTALEILEAGKSWTEADADVAEAIDFCGYYAMVMRELGQRVQTQPVPGEDNYQEWWPRGTGLVIAPWNFPLAILTGMTAAALVTGNTVVVKPSDQTPVLAVMLMDLFREAGVPPGVLHLIMGPGATVGAHLVSHSDVDFIVFTGSKAVGLRICEAAGRTRLGQAGLKRVICEMGGKNALIVDSDADLDEAVQGCITSAFGYQGQKCSALSRLIVLQENYARFMSRLISAADSLQVGPAEEPGSTLGPVISREAQSRILESIEHGKREATLAWQGSVPAAPQTCYVPPVIFTDVPPTSRLFREEIFGPVLSVTKAVDFGEALALANQSEFALTGGVYSRSPAHLERARAEFICGNLYLNRPITGAIVERQPFGGFKMSGGGTKAGGWEYLQNFLVPRVVTENRLRRGFAPDEETARGY